MECRNFKPKKLEFDSKVLIFNLITDSSEDFLFYSAKNTEDRIKIYDCEPIQIENEAMEEIS
jgi:hypothetical protein